MDLENSQNWMLLPIYWINTFFKVKTTSNPTNEKEIFEVNFFKTGRLKILDCRFKLPRANQWQGHPFYLEVLKTYEKLVSQDPVDSVDPITVDRLYSIPLWFNKVLGTKYDVLVSMKGFNHIKDLFPNNQQITRDYLNERGYQRGLVNKIVKIVDRMPQSWGNLVNQSVVGQIVVFPNAFLFKNGEPCLIKKLTSKTIYSVLISDKIIVPRGVLIMA